MKSDNFLLETLEKRYNTEIERRDKLEERLSVPLAIIVIELGFLSYLFQNLPDPSFQVFPVAFFGLLGVSIAFFAISVVHLFGLMIGQRFAFISGPNEIHAYSVAYMKYLESTKAHDKELASQHELEEMLIEQYREYGQYDVDSNNKRTRRLSRLKLFIVISLIALFVAYIPFGVFSFGERHEKIQRVELVNH